jgi:DNA-binding response OmpR family regulator
MARILLIEDNDLIRTLLRDSLAFAGHTVIEARNGKEGLELFRQAGTDLVLTDIVMPEKEGLAVLMELRKSHPAVNIIAMSGGGLGSGRDYLAAAKLLGAAKVLLKPFPIEVLLAAIDELLLGRLTMLRNVRDEAGGGLCPL